MPPLLSKMSLNEFRRRVVAGSFPQYSDLAAGLGGLRFVPADPIRAPARAHPLGADDALLGFGIWHPAHAADLP